MSYEGIKLRTARSISMMGLDGTGQIVTVLDNGVNFDHSFFSDSSVEITGPGTYPTHRKIIKYENWTETPVDLNHTHGTFVSGLIAGRSEDPLAMNSLYEGAAYNAKLHIIEVDDSNYSWVDFNKVVESMDDIGSKISSNNWHYGERSIIKTQLMDEVAFKNKDKIFIFPTGNQPSDGVYNVYSPSDSKNVLTIQGISRTIARLAEEDTGPYEFSNESFSFQVDKFSNETTFFQKKSQLIDYRDLEVSTEDKENVIFYTETCLTEKAKAKVVVYRSDLSENCSKTGQNFIVTIGNDMVTSLLTGNRFTVRYPISYNWGLQQYDVLRGPGYNGISKPDLTCFGYDSRSANANSQKGDTSYDSLIQLPGVSASSSIGSGLAAMARQFFTSGKYPGITDPSGTLMRAMLINGGRVYGNGFDPSFGHGILILGEALGYGDSNDSGKKDGTRFIDKRKVLPNQHITYNITTKYPKTFRATIAYSDPPRDLANSALLTADLNLYVQLEDGSIIPGNGLSSGSQQATTEKVFVGNISAQTLQVHVFSNDFLTEEDEEIEYSLAVAGGFELEDQEVELKEVESQCINNCSSRGVCETGGVCKCHPNYTGDYCQVEVPSFTEGAQYPVESRRMFWTRFEVPPHNDFIFKLQRLPDNLYCYLTDESPMNYQKSFRKIYSSYNGNLNDIVTTDRIKVQSNNVTTMYVGCSTLRPGEFNGLEYQYFHKYKVLQFVEFIYVPTPNPTPNMTPTPQPTTPVMTAHLTPYQTAETTPDLTPFSTVHETIVQTQKETAFETPYLSPFMTVDSTPFGTPYYTFFQTIDKTTPPNTPSMTTPLPSNSPARTIYIGAGGKTDSVDSSRSGSTKKKTGVYIGVVFGVLAVIVLAVLLVVWYFKWRDRSSSDDSNIVEKVEETNVDPKNSYMSTINFTYNNNQSDEDDEFFLGNSEEDGAEGDIKNMAWFVDN
ncbi:Clan SB, family S8, subtilisin-like serine peptidase [Trichomonas vaginalis G3]|uniref:Clan SB, family S8, subtilisin-like serine peptidase n=1 Tax=Trichomonas vaginalis (strain ATCC PRA-98 / G3) TaxID=412133 RepID=A2EII3_TRIV3|nr:proprotein convertase subtilisin/kexin-related family [Trichomonas vaginalis G3]EAY07504.1 Clan SB, family S8, subtilisin-like serine peptidase [Trichomonas vaginalis G3]KAI5550543.1 proprotein convertase subtilisin/kexin-related family [Trichomonas vaginalis G3]|eukprot:XP_001319727.1 Clan SB, family S8, subtilisin-like serine peptidase [Trichomonas vaginalis G3]